MDFSSFLPNLLTNYVPVVTMRLSNKDRCISTDVLPYVCVKKKVSLIELYTKRNRFYCMKIIAQLFKKCKYVFLFNKCY